MKAKVLTAVFVWGVLLAASTEVYACPPTAVLVVEPNCVWPGKTVTLDGSDSTDTPPGYITKYEWDFTNNGSYDYYETSSHYPDGAFDGITTHVYETSGIYTAKLRVRDDDSLTGTDTCVIDVNSEDLDNDGLPGLWESFYGLSDSNFADADEDLDSDGYNNLCEYLHGSDPNDDTKVPDPNFPITIYVPSDVNSIQRSINASIDGDTVTVSPGTYYEVLDFGGRAITVTNTDPNDWTVVALTENDANDPNEYVVAFENSEDGNSVLKGFVITGGDLGIYCDGASPTISNCVITDNGSGLYNGGGLYDCNGSSPIVTNCFFVENDANYGGGVYNLDSWPTITNCVFSKNSATLDGGGIYDSNSSPTLISCTLSGNSAGGNGGAMYNDTTSCPLVTNCIIWDNDAGGSGDEVYNSGSADPNFSYCDIKGCGGSGGGWNSSFGTDGGGNVDGDPNFIGANDPAGPDDILGTFDDGLRPEPNGACLDAADGNAAPSTDISGWARHDFSEVENTGVGDPNYAEMGAYESRAIIFVDADATGADDGTSWQDAYADLQDALAGAAAGDEIWVALGTYKPTSGTDRSISFDLVASVGVYGGFAGTETAREQRDWETYETILSGDINAPGDANDNSYHVVEGNDHVVLDGFTVTAGNADTTSYREGGGMYNSSCSSLTVKNCLFRNNFADYDGGGMYNSSSSVTVMNCTFTNNTADDEGGGITNSSSSFAVAVLDCTFINNTAYDGGGLCAEGPSTVQDCLFKQNDAVDEGGGLDCDHDCNVTNCFFISNDADYGGAIYNDASSTTITNCILYDNEADFDGGGIYNNDSDATITNCTFHENETNYDDGGAIYNNESSPVITNCIFWDNHADDDGDEIYNDISSDPNIGYCDIEDCGGSGGGWDLDLGNDDGGNIDSEPDFADENDPNGDDNIYGTADDGLHIVNNSPCVDAADGNAAVATDVLGLGRVDISDVNNTGTGTPDYVDMGAYESGHDSDSDGLLDEWEIVNGLDPGDTDTDDDGMPDGWEVNNNLDPLDDTDASEDPDSDGLTNLQEYANSTDPHDADTDDDYMPDKWEVDNDLDPTDDSDASQDPDSDDLTNLEEYYLGLDPNDDDTDDDDLEDGWEFERGMDPNDSDTDDDGMPDGWEYNNGLTVLGDGDAGADMDGDGLTNLQEYNAQTDPNDTDSDDDGMTDGWENTYGLDPLDANDAETDKDNDTYSNIVEFFHNSDPNDANSTSEPNTITVPTDIGTIQSAIDVSIDGDVITVLAGTYYENVDFKGKAVTVRSTDPNDPNVVQQTVIDANSVTDMVVYFHTSEDANSVLSGFTLTGGKDYGAYVYLCGGTISKCVITGNGYYGVYCNKSDVVIENCVIEDQPYGIYNYSYGSSASPTIRYNHIRHTSSYDGIYLSYSSANVKSNWIYDNGRYGIRTYQSGSAVLRNNTIVSNTAAGIYVSSTPEPNVSNCIIWDNSDDLYNCTATYSCIEDGDSGTGNISDDPCFVDADANDFHLEPNSPCINAGDPNADPNYAGEFDIDGQVRVRGENADMGGDEGPVTWYVDIDANGAGTGFSWADAFTVIQDAIDTALGGDEIVVAEGTYYESIDFGGKAVTVRGTDPQDSNIVAATIVDGNDPNDPNDGNTPVVIFRSGDDGNSALSGLTITGGRGVYCGRSSSPEIANCVIRDHNGIGVLCILSSASISNCIIADNSGSGISGGSPAVANCTIVNNSIYGIGNCDGTIRSCIIWGNDYNDLYDSNATYSCIEDVNDANSGQGNVNYFPYFVDANSGNYHLLSYSPCIDTGDPNADYSNEPNSGGGRINMGAYGNTSEAALVSDDNDVDGLPDSWELLYWPSIDTNDANDDPDSDDVNNIEEYHIGLDPNDDDTDGDGLSDDWEIANGLDPQDSDCDDDGIPDGWEQDNGFDPLNEDDASSDGDSDGLTNLQEYNLGADPNDSDSDDDGMPDGWENTNGFDPADSNDADGDLDNDGYSNVVEYYHESDPNDSNSLSEPNTITVPTDVDSIQFAIDVSIEGDVIEVLQGTYYESIEFDGNVITIRSSNPNDWSVVVATVIDANDSNSTVVTFGNGEDANCVLTGLTITGGNYCVYCANSSSPTISRCVIEDSNSHGVYCSSGSPLITNSIIRLNGGDAVYSASTEPPTIKNSLIYGNSNGLRFTAATSAGTVRNNTIMFNDSNGVCVDSNTAPAVSNCILWKNGDDLHNCTATYSCIEDANDANGTGNTTSDPCLLNVFEFVDATTGADSNTTIKVADANLYEVNDVIEYDDDGVPRAVTDVNTVTDIVTFANDPLDASSASGICIYNWGSDVNDVNADFRIASNSPCINAGDPNADPNYAGEYSIYGPERVRGKDVDMGADEGPVTWYVDIDANGAGSGFSWQDAFTAIKDAVDAAISRDQVIIAEGTYFESVDFGSKALAVQSTDPCDSNVVAATIIDANDPNDPNDGNSPVVTLSLGENVQFLLSGLTIAGGTTGIHCGVSSSLPVFTHCVIRNNTGVGIQCGGSSPTIENCIITNNAGSGIRSGSPTITNCTLVDNGSYGLHQCNGPITNCIIWGNRRGDMYQSFGTYLCLEGRSSDQGNLSYFPYFADANGGDYHLLSYSPCIDAGDPNSDYSSEPNGGGGRINMGAYGNTGEAALASDDNDVDGLPDTWELLYWPSVDTNDANGDPDSDDVNNLDEYHNGLDPNDDDTDGDGLTDDWEIANGLNPRISDSDYDGMPDKWENDNGLDPLDDSDAGADDDQDGLTNLQEYEAGTDPGDSDSDDDGMRDGWENAYGLNPLDANDASSDADSDGYSNVVEYMHGSDPNDSNSLSQPIKMRVPIDVNSIQSAIDLSIDGDIIEVLKGHYYEAIDFGGKAVTLTGTDPNNWLVVESTVIDANDYNEAILFDSSEDSNSVVTGLTLKWANNGVHCANSSPTITKCIIQESDSNGILVDQGGSPAITNCMIESHGGDGIHIYDANSTPVIKNSWIYDNHRGIAFGGADSNSVIRNNTIVRNTTYGVYVGSASNLNISNCILWDNGTDDPCNCTASYCCIENGADANNYNIDSDPEFFDGDDPNTDFRLYCNSPCKDKGDPNQTYSGEVDIEGHVRDANRVDIGADEICEVHNTTQDLWYRNIQDAIDDANSGDVVEVYDWIFYESIDFAGKAITVKSTNPTNWTTVEATVINANDSDANVVTFDSGEDSNSVLQGFTLTGGKNGVYCDNSSAPTIRNCLIADNNSVGIACISGSPLILNNKIRGNNSEGIYSSSATPPQIKVNWIYSNDVGIKLVGPTSVATMFNNTVADNVRVGIHKASGTDPNINSCIIWGHDSNDLIGCNAIYSCIQDPNDADGTGNFIDDPRFIDRGNNNYHISVLSSCRLGADPNISRVGFTDIDGRRMSVRSVVDANSIPSFNLEENKQLGVSMSNVTYKTTLNNAGGANPELRFVNAYVNDTSVVGYWMMDDASVASKKVVDSSGYGLDGMAQQVTYDLHTEAGKKNGALTFDRSVPDYITTESAAFMFANDFAVSLWFKADDTTFGSHLVWQGQEEGDGWGDASGHSEMHISIGDDDGTSQYDNYLCFYLGKSITSNSDTLYINTPFSDTSSWNHVVVVVEDLSTDPKAEMYLNGASVGTDTGTIVECHESRDNWDVAFMMGKCGTPTLAANQNYFDGTMDEVMTSFRALTPEEIGILYSRVEYKYLGDGKSWATAYRYLKSALDDTLATEIWVARGTYYPVEPEQDPATSTRRRVSFVLRSDLEIYGGLAGIEEPEIWDLKWRHLDTNKSILNGDIGVEDYDYDNCHHVVTAMGVTNVLLDGLTITGGGSYLPGETEDRYGAGINTEYSDLTVRNCTITDNWADKSGGGAYFWGGSVTVRDCVVSDNMAEDGTGGGLRFVWSDSALVDNCTFVSNRCFTVGGGMYLHHNATASNCRFVNNESFGDWGGALGAGGHCTIANCVFAGNQADWNGGAIDLEYDDNVTMTNCTFSKNSAGNDGGGIYIEGCSPTITNCILWGNTDDGGTDESAQIHVYSGSPSVSYCCIQGPLSTFDCCNNIDSNPQFVDDTDPNGPDGKLGTLDDGLVLETDSPCIDAGDDSAVPDDVFDLDGDQASIDQAVRDNLVTAYYKMNESEGTQASDSAIAPDYSERETHDHGTISGSTWSWTPGTLSGALSLGGADYVDLGTGTTLDVSPYETYNTLKPYNPDDWAAHRLRSVLTIALWFRTSTSSQRQGLIGDMPGDPVCYTTPGYRLFIESDNKVTFSLGTESCGEYVIEPIEISSDTTVTDGDWHHVVATYNANRGGYALLYLDGQQATKTYRGQFYDNVEQSSYSVCIGCMLDSGGGKENYFNGEIDNVIISTRSSLFPYQVEELYERIPYDAAKVPRFKDGDHDDADPVDMGAYELPRIWYVDAGAADEGDGKSWATAFDSIDDDWDWYDDDAVYVAADGDEIWVAEHASPYIPRDSYWGFQIPSGVRIYGGFADTPTETARNDRDWKENVTTLSGNDATEHVVFLRHLGGDELFSNVVIDGFTITGGQSTWEYGGGMLIYGYLADSYKPDLMRDITVAHCTFEDNQAAFGGGLSVWGATVSVVDCNFYNNQAIQGGGVYNEASVVSYLNCVFAKNHATGDSGNWGIGGGMYNGADYMGTLIENCTFAHNKTGTKDGEEILYVGLGGAIFNEPEPQIGTGEYEFGTLPEIKNCIFWENEADYGGEICNWPVQRWDRIHWASALVSYSSVHLMLNGPKCYGVRSYSYGPWAAWKPYFAEPAEENYHLRTYSPCIDIGSPESDHSKEPSSGTPSVNPYINLGRYGNTDEAAVFGDDTNGDGLPDEWVQIYLQSDPRNDPIDDPDHDWLTNWGEYLFGTDPLDEDTDGDYDSTGDYGKDGWELANGFDPCTCDDWSEIFLAHSLPYFTSFEQDQGYHTGWLHLQNGWQTFYGYASVALNSSQEFQYVRMEADTDYDPTAWYSEIYKEFNDQEDHHQYVRFAIRPAPDTIFEIYDDAGEVIAGLWFWYFAGPPEYFRVAAYYYYRSVGYYVATIPFDCNIPYDDTLETISSPDDLNSIEIKLDWDTRRYEVYHLHTDGETKTKLVPEQSWACMHPRDPWCGEVDFAMGGDSSTLKSISVGCDHGSNWFRSRYGQPLNPDPDRDPGWVAFDRFSISDYPSTEPLSEDITSPCHCDKITQSRVPVEGYIHWGKLAKYEIRYYPIELFEPGEEPDPGDPDASAMVQYWFVADTGYTELDAGGTLGYWYTSSIPNGYYYLGIAAYDDVGLVTAYHIHEGPIAVMTEQKANTFHHQEEPDISVPWKGQFPFELKRTYNNNLRIYSMPLPNGWTHNYQVTLTEDTRFYWDAQDFMGIPYYDASNIPFGDIWVTYPNGSRRLFRHQSTGGDTSYDTHWYYPVVGKDDTDDSLIIDRTGDRIRRVTDDYLIWYVDLDYTLLKRDGTEYHFETAVVDVLAYGHPWGGCLGWLVDKAKLDTIEDRFGNSLDVTWFSDAQSTKPSVKSVSDGRRTIRFELDGSNEYYISAKLTDGGTNDTPTVTYQEVTYDWTWNDGTSTGTFIVTNKGEPDVGIYDYQTDSFDTTVTYQTRYEYEDDRVLKRIYRGDTSGTELMIRIIYDAYGNIYLRRDYVESGNYVQTTYNYDYGEENNELRTEETVWFGPDRANWRKTTIEQDKRGRIIKQEAETSDSGGVATKYVSMKYSGFRFQPYEIEEAFDGRTRKTVNSYQTNRVNVDIQKVYEVIDETDYLVSYADMDCHPDYDFETQKTSYQTLGSDPNPSQGATGKVEKISKYGLLNGQLSAGGDYLLEEHVLVDESPEPDKYAVTEYEYDPAGTGLVFKKIEQVDGQDLKTRYEYDDNGYRTKQEVELVVDSGDYQWIKKFHYDEIGQLILKANHRGGVTYNHYDGFGRIWKVETFEDTALHTRDPGAGFVPDTYDNFDSDNDITLTSETYYTYDYRGNKVYEEKIRHSFDIANVDTSNKQFKIDGKHAWQFPVTSQFRVAWSTGNDGVYTVQAVTETSTQTVITVSDSLDATVDGLLQVRGTATMQHTFTNQIKTIINDDGSQLTNTYDNRGLKTEEWRYDAVRNDWRGIEYEYDQMDRLIWENWYTYESPDPVFGGTTIKRQYNEYYDSGKKKREDLYGSGGTVEKRTDFEYDILDRMTKSSVDPTGLNLTIEYGYDDVGNLIHKKDPIGNYVFFDYDNANRESKEYFVEPFVTNIATTYGNATVKKETTYYENDLVKSIKQFDYDDYSRTHDDIAYKEFKYDALRRSTEVKEAMNKGGSPYNYATTTYEYLDNGSSWPGEPVGSHYQVKITDPESQCTYMEYGAFGQVAGFLYPSNQYERLEYNHGDASIRSKSVFDSGGTKKEIRYYYDGYGRLRRVYYPPNNDTYYVEHLYDGFGRKTTFIDNRTSDDKIGGTGGCANTIQYDHDELDRVIEVTDHDGYMLSYSYTADDQKKNIAVYSGEETVYNVEYTYDAALRLDTVSEPPLGADKLIADIDHDNNGNRSRITYSMDGGTTNKVYIDYTYDPDNQLRKFTTTGGPTFTFGGSVGSGSDWADIDGLGRLADADEQVTKTDDSIISYDIAYSYDMRSRLTSGSVDDSPRLDWSITYTYNDNGNMASRDPSDQAHPTCFKYDKDGDGIDDCQVMTSATENSVEVFSLSWDDNGSMLQNDMASTDDTALTYNWDKELRSGQKGSATVTLKYDPQGNRVWKNSSVAGERRYVVDIVGELPVILLEIDPSNGDVDNSYIYAHSQIIAKHDQDGAAVSHDNKYLYLHDRLGCVRQIISWDSGISSVDVEQMYTYKPFGELLESDGSLDNTFMFASQWFDSEIDEYYLRARQYDPYLGRFTSRDPLLGQLEKPLTLHRYLYCLNDPLNNADPSGKIANHLVAGIIGGYAVYAEILNCVAYSTDIYTSNTAMSNQFFGLGNYLANVMPAIVTGNVVDGYLGALSGTISEASDFVSERSGYSLDPGAEHFMTDTGKLLFHLTVLHGRYKLGITGEAMNLFNEWKQSDPVAEAIEYLDEEGYLDIIDQILAME